MEKASIKTTGLIVLTVLAFNYTSAQNGVGVNTTNPKSSFEVSGSFGKKASTITSSTTLDETYSIIVCNNGASAINVTLPAANTCAGRIYHVKKNASSSANVTLVGTIDGVSNYIMNQTNQAIELFSDGTEWKMINGGSATDTDAWSLLGNGGTVAGTNFLGTTDAVDLVFKTDNAERIRVMSDGKVGIGNPSPTGELDLQGTARTDLYISSTGVDAEDYADIYMMTNGSSDAGIWRNAATKLLYGGAYSLNFGTIDVDNVTLVTNNESRLLVDGNTGYVGIGVTAPAVPSNELEVAGDVKISGKIGVGADIDASAKLLINDGHIRSIRTTAPTITGTTTYVLGSQSISNATDIAGKLSITTTAAAGTVTITFNAAYNVAPIVVLTPTNSAAATDVTKMFVTSSTTTFTINFSASPSAGAHTYNYHIIETQ